MRRVMMINSQYKSVITSAGHTANTQSIASGTTIVFDEIAFGSGGLVPNENATDLVKEEVRIKIHSVVQNQTDTNILEIEAVVPAHIGGFTINEAALYLDDGTLYAVASLPESYKPILDQGAGKEFSFVFFLTSVGVENVALTIDGGASFVTTNYFQNELKKYAFVTGDETKKFKVADAQAENEAVNKKQIDELESRLNDSIGTINNSIETLNDSVGKNTTATTVTTATKVVGAGFMGEFGQGLWRIFRESGTFVIPIGVTSVRVRVVGAGGGAGIAASGIARTGGGGGGYAHGIFNVTAGDSYTVTVGTGGAGGASPTAGGTSSFGLLISATGGDSGSATVSAIGGQGTGGDFQSKGGSSLFVSGAKKGGGGAGSQLGDGGNGDGGGGGCGGNGGIIGGGSAFANGTNFGAQDITGVFVGLGDGAVNPINATIRFPFDSFTGGGGSDTSSGNAGTGGIGAGGGGKGGSGSGGNGGIGGGGGSTNSSSGGNGGIGGGSGAGTSSNPKGGDGLVVIEW